MKYCFNLLLFCFLFSAGHSLGQNKLSLISPNGTIVFSMRVSNDGPSYDISFKGKKLIENAGLSILFKENGSFQKNLQAGKPALHSGTESYRLIVGKTASVNDRYNELHIPLTENDEPHRRIDLRVRAFNDGIAFRYEFPQQNNLDSIFLADEFTSFTPVGNPQILTLQLPNFTTSHEGEYTSAPWIKLKEDTLMDMPTLLAYPGNVFMAITEASLVNYAGMYLLKRDNKLVSKLSPLPSETSVAVKAALPHKSPWRVLLIGNRLGSLIESNIITSLNEPNKIRDTSWIKPGKTTFPWWNGTVVSDSIKNPGNNFETNKYYIDFCARNGLEFHSVVEGGGHEWYTNDGENYQPGPGVDVTKPVAGLNMQQVCDYAKQKGVGIRVWVHWKALYPKIDTAFALFEKWGIKGMMIDFMDRDDQEMVNIQEEMLQKAAKHKMHVQFHGAYKPTGLSRTYPNEFTREGTLNYEVNKWDKKMTPDHDLNIVFTRMLAGPSDYHLGGFRAVPESQFQVQYIKPLMMGTRCHMLAMYVVLENYQGMVCDFPEAYEGEPGFDFIKAVPVIWDETKVLDAKLHQYATIARRKNDEWYVGAINNRESRTINVSFDFLPEGTYTAEIFTDAPDAGKNPNNLVRQSHRISNTDKMPVKLAAGGGLAIILKKAVE